MKHIKSIIRFAALLLLMVCAQSVKAQQTYIMVHKVDGTVLRIAVSDVDSVTFREWSGPIFSYEYVDLGLSVQWATCNVGAQSPEQAGGYFAWGETEEKDEYYSDNNKFIDSDGKLTKYNLWQSLGKVDMKYRLDPEDDAAAVLLGDGWRTPTREEFQELRDFCDWAPAVLNGVQGYRVTSQRNNNSIFLPLTGERWNNDTIGYNRYAYYYSNTMAIDYANSSYDVYSAYMYYVDEDYYGWYENTYYRTGGLAIRPVYSSSWVSGIAESAKVSIEETEVNIEVGQSVTLNGSFVLADGSEISPEWKSSNAMIARVDYSGRLYGVSEGQCMIYASHGNNSDSCLVTVTGFEQEMEYVDLGLSVNWATCNIGASRPEYVGLYFAWGETEAKAEYEWSTYKYSNENGNLTKYNQYPSLGVNGFIDNLTVLEPDDDAAHVIWGDEWRMPTYEEITELIENCDFHEIKGEDGILGYYVTSRVEGHEKSSIFIPYTEDWDAACVWTSSIAGRRSDYAAILVNNTNAYIIARCAGFPIRPVCPNYNYVPPTLELSSNALTVVVGKTSQLSAIMNNGAIDPTKVTWISSDTTVAIVDIYGQVTAIAEGTCIITASYKDQSADCVVGVIEAGKPQYVDLGLSVEWATFNIGATSPEELGNYYAWGETEVKDYYDENNYKWFDAENNAFLKYNLDSKYGDIDLKYRLDPDDDVAHVTWGDGWRMPTNEEFQELIDNCYWSWVNEDGFYGYVVQSSVNGNSIFLPAAGYKDGEDAYNPYDVIYMSSSLTIGNGGYYNVYCLAGRYLSTNYRFNGYPVRAVHSSVFAENTITVNDLTLSEQSITVEAGQQKKLDYEVDADTLVATLSWISDNLSVAKVSNNGIVLGIAPGECTITVSLGGFTQTCTVTVTESETVKEWVDLGLSVKWATTNIGASRPEYAGGHYAWGETVMKDTYDWEHHSMATYEGDSIIITKYNEVDGLTTLEPGDDVAHLLWGENWRMPTIKELNELVNECEWTRTQVDGIAGYEVTGPNGNSIFLPASGYMYNSNYSAGGPYFYSSSSTHGRYYADYIYPIGVDYLIRTYGFPVRAVTPYSIDDLDCINLNRKSIRLMEGNTYQLEIKEKISDALDTEWISTDESVVTVQDGLVTALGLGTANVIVILDEFSDTCEVTVAAPEYVNLGLSVNWATLNIGAYSPEEYGDYYAWGETETKSDYSWSTYKFGDETSQTKYSEDVDGKTVLDPEDDVAHVLWGGDWRMPNVEEFNELIEMCSWEMTTINGIKGYVITSKVQGYEDNWIFLPLAGYIYESGVINSGMYGDYWSSSKAVYDNSPFELYMGKSFFQTGEWDKNVGLPIRPVCKNNEYVDKVVQTDNLTVTVDETVDGEKVYRAAPRIVADPANANNQCIVVTAIPDTASYFDAQLFIMISDSVELQMGDELELSFKYKADSYFDASTEIHSVPGQWVGYGPGSIYFTPYWQEYNISTTIEDPDQRTFVINLNYVEEDKNNFYFDNIKATITSYQVDGFNMSSSSMVLDQGSYDYLYVWDNNKNNLTSYSEWVSTNDSVATVNEWGEVYAVAEGTCYIIASYKDYTASCEVTVTSGGSTPMPYHYFTVSEDGTGCQYYYVDDNGYGHGAQALFKSFADSAESEITICTEYYDFVVYPSEKEARASYEALISGLNEYQIDSLGVELDKETIISTLAVMIGVDRDDVIAYMRQEYENNAPLIHDDDTYISLNIYDLNIRVGDIFPMSYYTNSQEGVRWESTDDSVAVVDMQGEVTAVGVGSCFIVVSTGDVSDSCQVTVRKQYIDTVQAKYDFMVSEDSLNAMFYYSSASFYYEMVAQFGVNDSIGALVCVEFGVTMGFETDEDAQEVYENMTANMTSEQIESYGIVVEGNVLTYTSPETIGLGIDQVLTMMRQTYNDMIGETGQSEYQEGQEG